MARYHVIEYDEDIRGHPSFLLESDNPGPLAPALIIVIRPGRVDVYREDGSPWPEDRLTPGDALTVAVRKHRELDAAGVWDRRTGRILPDR